MALALSLKPLNTKLYALWNEDTQKVSVTGMETSPYPMQVPGLYVQYEWFELTGHLVSGTRRMPITLSSQGRNCAFSETILFIQEKQEKQEKQETKEKSGLVGCPLYLRDLTLSIGNAKILEGSPWTCKVEDIPVLHVDRKLKVLQYKFETKLDPKSCSVPVQLKNRKQEIQSEISLPYPGAYLICGSWPLDRKCVPVLTAEVYWEGHQDSASRWSLKRRAFTFTTTKQVVPKLLEKDQVKGDEDDNEDDNEDDEGEEEGDEDDNEDDEGEGDEEEGDEEEGDEEEGDEEEGDEEGDDDDDKEDEEEVLPGSRKQKLGDFYFYSIVSFPPRPRGLHRKAKLMVAFHVMPFPYVPLGPTLEETNILELRRLYLPK